MLQCEMREGIFTAEYAEYAEDAEGEEKSKKEKQGQKIVVSD